MPVAKFINGMHRTRDEVVIENQNLVKKMAAKYEYKAKLVGIEYLDLVSFGTIGLIKAFDDFNDTLGFRFSTYAVPKIKGEMTRAILRSDPGAHYPSNIKRDADQIQTRKLEGRSVEEISEALNMPMKKVKLALEYITQGLASSLDLIITSVDDKELSSFGDLIGKDQDYTGVIVEEFIGGLKKKEKEIVQMLLKKKTNIEIGSYFGTSHQSVKYHIEQIKNKWAFYYYGLPAGKKEKVLKKYVGESEIEEMKEKIRISAGKGGGFHGIA